MEVSSFVPFSSQVPKDNAMPWAWPAYNHLVLKHLSSEDLKVVVRANYIFPPFFLGGAHSSSYIHSYVGSKNEPLLPRKKKRRFLSRIHNFLQRSNQVSQFWQNKPGNQWRKWSSCQLSSHPSILLGIVRDSHNFHVKLASKFMSPHFFLQGTFKPSMLVHKYVCICVGFGVWISPVVGYA